MRNKIIILFVLLSTFCSVFGQDEELINCDTNIVVGQNLIVNGGFEDGDFGFSTGPDYNSWNKNPSTLGYSVAGDYYVGSNASFFNSAFSGSPKSGNQFLMIDGLCDKVNPSNRIVWQQTVNIAKDTRYFFEVFISNLEDANAGARANLKFEIGDSVLAQPIVTPTSEGVWISVVDSSWFSGSISGPVTIRIINDQVEDCGFSNDFALDDITFKAGCDFGEQGITPELGPNLTFCGTDGKIVLSPKNISDTDGNKYQFLWSTSDADTLSTLEITNAGTYALCMKTNGSCIKTDKIRIGQYFDFDLKNDTAVCREITDTLSVSHTGPKVSYKWFRNGALISGATDQTYIPFQVGVYKVEVTDKAASCGTKVDSMELSQGTIPVDLGDDIDLCNPATAVLDPSYSLGSGYTWVKDGDTLGNFRNQQTIQINEVGTYKVIIKDLICDDVEDEIVVSSSTIQAVNANFCPADGDSVKLSITNAPADSINYVWYSDAALTDSVGFGLNFKTADTLTKTTSFYVKDQSTVSSVTGPIGNSSTFSSGSPFNSTSEWVEFTVNNDFTLDSLTMYAVWSGFQNVIKTGVKILEWDNGPVGPVVAEVIVDEPAISDHCNCPEAPGAKQVLAIGADLEKGKTYRIYLLGKMDNGSSSQIFAYQPTSPSGLAGFSFNSDFITLTQAVYGSSSLPYFNWAISSGSVCDPVQVQAVYDPIACAGCTPPELENTALNLGVSCNSGPVTLKANVIGGTNNGSWNYLWTRNGDTLLTATDDSLVVAFPDSGNYTVTVADNNAPNICFETREFRVNLTSPPEPTVDIEIRLDEAICLVGDVSTSATVQNFTPAPSVFQWFRNDTLQTTTADNITISLKDGDELKVSVSGLDGCGNSVTASDSVTVQGLEEITPTVGLSAISSCQGELVTVEATITPASAAINASYTWSINTSTQTTNTDTLQATFADGDSVSVVATIVADGCYTTNTLSASSKAQIFTALIPEVYISADKNDVCENELPIVFAVDSLKNGGMPTYKWFINDSEQPAETGLTFEPTSLDSGDVVKVEMTSSLGCVTTPIAADSVDNIIINALVEVSVRLSDDPLSSCAGDSMELEALVYPDTVTGSYQWKLNGNDVVVGTDSYKYKSAFDDNDVVTVEFTPAINCPAADTVQADNPATISITTPSVTLGSINLGTWCEDKTNGFEVINSTLGGNTPLFEWRINSNPLLEPETGDTIVRTAFQEGDTVKVTMITSAPNEVCTNPTDFAVVGPLNQPEDVTIELSNLTICDTQELVVSASDDENDNHGNQAKYTWMLNSELLADTVSTISPSNVQDGDTISVRVLSSEVCVNFDTASTQGIVTLIPTPEVVLAANEIVLSDYEEVTLDASKSELSGATYSWSSSDTSLYEVMTGRFSTVAKVTPEQTQTKFYFSASRTENGTMCSDVDSINVVVDYSFVIPNAFTPNGDGLNDVFQIDNLEKLDAFRLQIFNRWGTLLYEQKGLSDFWDGTYNGNPVPVATYYYVFEYEMDGEEQQPKKDFISLIR